MVVEIANPPHDIYPCSPVEDSNLGIRGSCSTYKTRKDITDTVTTLSMEEADRMYAK